MGKGALQQGAVAGGVGSRREEGIVGARGRIRSAEARRIASAWAMSTATASQPEKRTTEERKTHERRQLKH